MEEIPDFKSLINRLNHIGIALSLEHNLNKLLDMIVSEIRDFSRSEGGSLYIKKGDELSFEVAQNEILSNRLGCVPFKTIRIPINHNSVSGYVASTGVLINIPDLELVGNDLPFSLQTTRDFDRKNGLKTVSMLAVPMKNHKDEIIGVIQLMNSRDEEGHVIPYGLWMQELVSSLASQAAVAISNSELIQNIKNLFEGLVTYSAQAIDARSPHTAGHSKRVAQLVMHQAESINKCKEGHFANVTFSEEELNELRMASWLHDIGKIGVREYVLDKVNKLSD
ncbi:MAG: GAF domain-containing protein, partial [Candidatus Latescibacterota bacterium]